MDGSPAMSGALEDLEESLRHALELVTACQERGTIRRFVTAGDLAKQLRRVKEDIWNKVMLASFAVNVQTTVVLLTIQAGGSLPRLQQRYGNLQNSALREFKLSELMAATDNFSAENIIGQGGNSTVFKGDFNDGKLVSIKKIHPSVEDFSWADIYDMHLIASKLQHKNIVKVLGYAAYEVRSPFGFWPWKGRKGQVKEAEYYFVEEYVPNRSLYKIIQELQLEWSSLFRIIQGVAQGLHCLHRQRLVHKDVKPSNILLDYDMNPKIADFDVMTALGDNDEILEYVVGTFGYLDPVYFAETTVSLKVDVFSFGITLIQTVGSIRMSKPSEVPYDRWAWEAWAAGQVEEKFDRSLFDESELMEIKRCVQVGLLCAQRLRADRPSMADVIEMLNGEKELPTPKKPEYYEENGLTAQLLAQRDPAALDEALMSPINVSESSVV
ncbi:hypothetical protein ACP4OV_001997 [Aristida adscensionis]